MSHKKTIQVFPSLDMRKLFRSPSQSDPVLSGKRIRFYASGRAALFHAVKSLFIPTGSVILLPVYNCGVEIEAVLRAGYKVDFFKVNNDLTINLGHINEKITLRTKAIFVPHYFGFPQNMSYLKELTCESDIVVFEDCAHALYSKSSAGEWLGTEGDFGLFSMRKTVSMPNGGAVLVNRHDLPMPGKGKSYFNPSILKLTLRSILENELNRAGTASNISYGLLSFYKKYISKTDSSQVSGADENSRWYYDVPLLNYENDISAISLFCSGKDDCSEIIACRRKNYISLKEKLRAYCAEEYVFPELPTGTCPLCLPLFIKQRDAIADRMNAAGVEPYIFGRHPHPLVKSNEFPELKDLAGSILGLPIHQQLNQEDMETVADVFIRSRER